MCSLSLHFEVLKKDVGIFGNLLISKENSDSDLVHRMFIRWLEMLCDLAGRCTNEGLVIVRKVLNNLFLFDFEIFRRFMVSVLD